MQCQKGVCVPTGGGTCDASAMNLAATQVGCVALTDAKGEQSFYCDQCDTLDPTKVANAACGGSCQQTLQWVTAWCAPGAICDPKTGACTGSAPPDDGINCAKTPELPECQNVDCAKTPNDPKCIDGGGSSSNGGGNSSSSGGGQPPCIPQTTPICEADTDSGQDVHLYGTLQSGIEISGCLIPPPSKITNPKGDTCVFAAGKPILYQYSCNGAAVVEQAAWCDVASGEDCDPKATTPETKGICQPFVSPECTDTSSDSKNLTQVGSVEGKDGFGHPFKETDHCEPAQGFGAVIKWSCLTGGSQGRKYDLVFCPNAAECIEGVCVPLQPPDVATCEKDPTSPACKDSDKDGIVDAFDNCVNDYNPQQEDSDGDTLGDACDAKPAQVDDTDKDGVPDPQDNCVQIPNPDQKDGDADGIGDACDNPTLDCGKTPNDPQCACPSGPPPQCDDTDKGSNLFFRGDVTMTFNGGGTVKQGDFCVDDFSAVIEVQCGPCGKFGFHKFGCPSQQCKDGQCGL
ncbi:MAG: thrombospondin type 3 repeat-containing protein [Deltaproteobacteria bacterium]|nr:thrombospondin type 3 repeat-containing protein [Deltaproteobacteria bacterium]